MRLDEGRLDPKLLCRRQILTALSAATVTGVLVGVPAFPVQARAPAGNNRRLKLLRYHGGARLTAHYYRNGSYQPAVLKQINRLCRDQLQNEATVMDPALIDFMYEVCRAIDGKATVHIISAYRTAKTNLMLRGKSANVSKKSLHMQGRAIDIRIPPHAAEEVAEAARSLNMGGVGLYRKSGFVHLDTGPARFWTR